MGQVFWKRWILNDLKQLSLSQKQDMKKRFLILTILMACMSVVTNAQNLKGKYYNEEYQIYLFLDVDNAKVKVPGDDIYGEIPGYLSSKRDSRLWLVIEGERVNENKAEITVINDYGSEDFTATLTEDSEGNITMKHLDGSTYKIVVNSKYVKIPKTLILKKQE